MGNRVLSALVLLGLAQAPIAGASHDAPFKAVSVTTDLVRAHTPCSAPNAVHDRVVVLQNACAPGTPLSAYGYGPAGQGKAQIRLVGTGVKMRFELKDVRTSTNLPADGVVFAGRLSIRLTDDGCSSASSCTVETTLGIQIPCAAGRCVAKTVYSDLFLPVGLGGAAEITQIDVLDDAGDRFATQGILLH